MVPGSSSGPVLEKLGRETVRCVHLGCQQGILKAKPCDEMRILQLRSSSLPRFPYWSWATAAQPAGATTNSERKKSAPVFYAFPRERGSLFLAARSFAGCCRHGSTQHHYVSIITSEEWLMESQQGATSFQRSWTFLLLWDSSPDSAISKDLLSGFPEARVAFNVCSKLEFLATTLPMYQSWTRTPT